MFILYGHHFSSYTWKALIALYASEVAFEVRAVDPQFPEHVATVRAASPLGKPQGAWLGVTPGMLFGLGLSGALLAGMLAFSQGAGHGTGYNDQIVIEARDFLQAIAAGQAVWPTFRDGYEVDRVVDAALCSMRERGWVSLA